MQTTLTGNDSFSNKTKCAFSFDSLLLAAHAAAETSIPFPTLVKWKIVLMKVGLRALAGFTFLAGLRRFVRPMPNTERHVLKARLCD